MNEPGAGPLRPALTAALVAELRGSIVQRVAGGLDLLVLELRGPGRTVHLALSVMPGAAGVAMLPEHAFVGEPDGGMLSFRDHLRGALVSTRIFGARVALQGRVLALELEGGPGNAVLLLDASPRPNLALLRADESHALRRPHEREGSPAEWAAAPADAPGGACDLAAESAELLAQRARVEARTRLAELARTSRAALIAARRLVERRKDDVGRLGDASSQRSLADALAATLHLVKRGQATARVTRLDDGTEADVPLDPRHSPGENLRRAYLRAAKSERGAIEARRLLQEARDKASALEGIADESRQLLDATGAGEPSPDDVAAIGDLLRRAGPWMPRRKAQGPAPSEAGGRRDRAALPEGVREFTSLDGYRILAGKSATSNDALTFRIARGNDAWLHAKDAPGPHVVLVLPKGAEIPQESLLDAATVAHVLGKLGDEPKGEVIWTRAKDVRRVKGAGPGKVTVTRERVIAVRVEPERMARLRLR